MYYFKTGKHQYNTDCLDDIVKKIRKAKYPNWELARQDVGAVYRAECLLYYSKGVANLAYQTRLNTITPLTKLYNNYPVHKKNGLFSLIQKSLNSNPNSKIKTFHF